MGNINPGERQAKELVELMELILWADLCIICITLCINSIALTRLAPYLFRPSPPALVRVSCCPRCCLRLPRIESSNETKGVRYGLAEAAPQTGAVQPVPYLASAICEAHTCPTANLHLVPSQVWTRIVSNPSTSSVEVPTNGFPNVPRSIGKSTR